MIRETWRGGAAAAAAAQALLGAAAAAAAAAVEEEEEGGGIQLACRGVPMSAAPAAVLGVAAV